MKYAIAVAVLLLTGCATRPQMAWFKDGSTQQDFNAELGQCRAQAFGVPGAMNNLLQVAIVQQNCMLGKGWEQRPR